MMSARVSDWSFWGIKKTQSMQPSEQLKMKLFLIHLCVISPQEGHNSVLGLGRLNMHFITTHLSSELLDFRTQPTRISKYISGSTTVNKDLRLLLRWLWQIKLFFPWKLETSFQKSSSNLWVLASTAFSFLERNAVIPHIQRSQRGQPRASVLPNNPDKTPLLADLGN